MRRLFLGLMMMIQSISLRTWYRVGLVSAFQLHPPSLQRQRNTLMGTIASLTSTSLSSSSSDFSPQSVAVVGSGAVGGYYGARLHEAGHNVKFYMRGEHYNICKQKGLNVTSVDGNIFIPPNELNVFDCTTQMGKVDWVVVALKSTSLSAIPNLIRPLLDPSRTRVLNIMNGLIEDDVLNYLKNQELDDNTRENDNHQTTTSTEQQPLTCCAAVYGGMGLICSNRKEPGHIDHTYGGLLSGGVAQFNHKAFQNNNNHVTSRNAFLQLWDKANVPIKYEDSLLRGRWIKNVWNLPFNGISVAMGGITIDVVVQDPGLRWLANAVMDETIAIANADLIHHHGHDKVVSSANDNSDEDAIVFLGNTEKKIMMDLSDGMGPYKTSTMLDLVHGRPMEVKYLFRKPLERAKQLGIPAPHLETLVLQIEAMQKIRDATTTIETNQSPP